MSKIWQHSALALLMALIFVPSHVNETTDPVDNLGGVLSVVLVGTLILAINFAPVPNKGTLALGLAAIAVAAAIAFVIRQRRARNPRCKPVRAGCAHIMSAAGRSSGIGAGSMLAAARLDHPGARCRRGIGDAVAVKYVSRVPRPPLDGLIDDLYYLEGAPPYARLTLPQMPSALLIVNLGAVPHPRRH